MALGVTTSFSAQQQIALKLAFETWKNYEGINALLLSNEGKP